MGEGSSDEGEERGYRFRVSLWRLRRWARLTERGRRLKVGTLRIWAPTMWLVGSEIPASKITVAVMKAIAPAGESGVWCLYGVIIDAQHPLDYSAGVEFTYHPQSREVTRAYWEPEGYHTIGDMIELAQALR